MGYSDKEIFEGLLLRDNRIIKFIYSRFLPEIKRYVTKNSGSSDDAMDVFQESIVTFYNKVRDGKIDVSKNLRAAFFLTGKTIWLTELRARKNTMTGRVPLDIFPDADPGLEEKLHLLLNRHFNKLDLIHRKVLDLFIDGKSYKEMEEITGISESNLRKKKHEAVQKILESLKNDSDFNELFQN